MLNREEYVNGFAFARGYAAAYGVPALASAIRKLASRASASYIAGACDAGVALCMADRRRGVSRG